MALDLTKITPHSPPPSKEANLLGRILIPGIVATALVGGAILSWKTGFSMQRLWHTSPQALEVLDVVTGPLAVVVVETGTVESASNTTIKCQVEALVGLVGGTATSGRASGQTTAASASASSAPTASAALTMTPSTSKSSKDKSAAKKALKKATTKAEGSASGGSSGSASSGSAGGSSSSSSQSGGATTKSSSSSSANSTSGSGSVSEITQRPTIRSFSLKVSPYVSLQPKRSSVASTKSAGQSGGGGGGGNRGGGGGGGGGTGEKPGSTRIIMIRDEGSSVKEGDIVCEFDSAAFGDAVLAQRIKTDSARSAMVQALSILDVNQIALNEYREGIYNQDLQLIRQYLSTCRTEQDRAIRNKTWSQETLDKGFRAPQQHQADVLSVQRADLALVVAELMEKRLVSSTGPKLIKALEANLQANRADALALESTYRTEADRLKRLEKMVANCTLRAPHEGTVVYSLPPSNGWRPATPAIMEGATVREGQPIFELPDPKKMRIRAKINESKVASIHPGQRTSVRIDAFPDRHLLGTVGEVTLIPAPASGPGSDVRIYFANIKLDSGDFEGLKPGLSAEVSFLVDDRPKITQIPINAIRWVGSAPFAAVSTSADRSDYRWQAIEVGEMNTANAEVIHGLTPGDKIVAHPSELPAPTIAVPTAAGPTLQAGSSSPTLPQG